MSVRFVQFIVAIPLLIPFKGVGQNYPVYASYPINPYLYNPAEAASESAFVYFNHRQQWTGIEGSPVLSTVTFNTLMDMTRVGLGGKISSYKRGLLNTTDAQFTFAYGMPVSKTSALYFGLSGGLISNGLDQNKAVDPNDPAIANYLANNMQPAGSAGFVFKSGAGFNLGVSLPRILEKPVYLEGAEGPAHSPFNQVLVTAYYKKKVEGKIVTRKAKGVRSRTKTDAGYAPLELYATYKYSAYQTSQAEVFGKLNLSDNFWVGGGYRQQYGLVANTGVSFSRFVLSYSFEPGGQPESGFSQGTHEILAGFRFGDEKKLKRKAPVLRSTLKPTGETQHNPRFKQAIDPEELEKQEQQEDASKAKKKYLVVARAFTDLVAADEYKKKLIEQKYNADIFYYAKDRRYYVHVFQTTKQHEANEEIRNLKTYTKLKEVHLVTVDEE